MRKDKKQAATLSSSLLKKKSMQQILCASRSNDIYQIEYMIQHEHVSPNFSNSAGQSALHIAAMWGNVQAVEVLLKHDANTNAQNKTYGNTPLHEAVISTKDSVANRTACIQMMLEKRGCDPYVTNYAGCNAFDCLQKMIMIEINNTKLLKDELEALVEMKRTLESGMSNYLRARSMNSDCAIVLGVVVPSTDNANSRFTSRHHFSREIEYEESQCTNRDAAWKFVRQIVAKYEEIQNSKNGSKLIDLLDEEGMFDSAKRMFDCQDSFAFQGISTNVTLAYHYTQEDRIGSISQNGLFCSRNGTFGQGIYLSDNPQAFQSKGTIGLIVAILQGLSENVDGNIRNEASIATTMIGKKSHSDATEEIVLQDPSQCVPIIRFDATLLYAAEIDLLSICHNALNWVIDESYNKRKFPPGILLSTTSMQKMNGLNDVTNVELPEQIISSRSGGRIKHCSSKETFKKKIDSMFPSMFGSVSKEVTRNHEMDIITYEAPETFSHKVQAKLTPSFETHLINYDSTCAICFSPMQQDERLAMINVDRCNHIFHHSCIMQAVKHNPRCPICRINISDEPQGHSPSGTMSISTCKSTFCSGYESNSNGTITIEYSMHGGIQKEYHPSPNKSYRDTTRTAYLPDNDEGRALLKRLIYAFRCGLTFQIGTSMTTGRSDCITWSSIHHKTRLWGGVRCHGYPDERYIINCNAELDSLGLPKEDDLQSKHLIEHISLSKILRSIYLFILLVHLFSHPCSFLDTLLSIFKL